MAPLFRDHVPSVGRALLQDAMLFDEPIGFAAYRVSGRYPWWSVRVPKKRPSWRCGTAIWLLIFSPP
jgi:hypothetical protein